jgi:phage antirepressor YoqD-like protein
VKRTIDTLAERGVIEFPQIEEVQIETSHGRKHGMQVYHLKKRDTLVVVAQLSPEFTARVVDRWQELEAARGAPALLTGPQLLAAALIEANATLQAQTHQIEAMRDDVEALDRIARAEGSLNCTEAAKNLGVRPKDLFDWLSHNGWIYKRAGSATWLGFQAKCNQGLLEHKTSTVTRADGSEKVTEQVRITAKGLTVLAKLIKPTARLIGGDA